MAWLTTSKTKILKHRAYKITNNVQQGYTLSDLIDQQMDALLTDLPEMVTVVEADLATLDSLDTLLTSEQGSSNAALIKADVLEWEGSGARTLGISQRYDSLRSRIASILAQDLEVSGNSAGGFGSGSLMSG